MNHELAIEFYQLSEEARVTLGTLQQKGRVWVIAGGGVLELLACGFVMVDEDGGIELTDKGRGVLPMLSPDDLNLDLKNLKLYALSLKERLSEGTPRAIKRS